MHTHELDYGGAPKYGTYVVGRDQYTNEVRQGTTPSPFWGGVHFRGRLSSELKYTRNQSRKVFAKREILSIKELTMRGIEYS